MQLPTTSFLERCLCKTTMMNSYSPTFPETESSVQWTYGKRALLEHCRVLSVESHDTLTCEPFHACAGDLFPNLEVLRIVSCWRDRSTHSLLCQPETACSSVTRLNPTKLVFHNLLADGLLVSPLSDWRPSRLDEAVYYIFDNVPTLHDRKRSTVLPYVILYCFPCISRVRIVFSLWEINCADEHEEPCKDHDDCAYCNDSAGGPMLVDKVTEPFRVMCGRADCQYQIYCTGWTECGSSRTRTATSGRSIVVEALWNTE